VNENPFPVHCCGKSDDCLQLVDCLRAPVGRNQVVQHAQCGSDANQQQVDLGIDVSSPDADPIRVAVEVCGADADFVVDEFWNGRITSKVSDEPSDWDRAADVSTSCHLRTSSDVGSTRP